MAAGSIVGGPRSGLRGAAGLRRRGPGVRDRPVTSGGSGAGRAPRPWRPSTQHACARSGWRAISHSSTRWPARSGAPDAPRRSPRVVIEQSSKGVGATGAGIYVRDLERGEAALLDVGGELDRRDSPCAVSLTSAGRFPTRSGLRGVSGSRGRRLGDGRRCRRLARPLGRTARCRAARRRGRRDRRALRDVPLARAGRAGGSALRRDGRPAGRPAVRPDAAARGRAGSRIRAERAGGQIRRLQAVTERLSAAATMADVAQVMVNEGRELFSADAALVPRPGRRSPRLPVARHARRRRNGRRARAGGSHGRWHTDHACVHGGGDDRGR